MSRVDTPTPLRSSLSAALGPRTGLVVGGRYRLVAPLAEGGMGSVWRAEHETLQHAVAVKFLAGGSMHSVEMRGRFEKEARLAAKIAEDSRHVVKVTDHGIADDGTPWLVMELLHGEGLDKVLRREGRLGLERASRIVRHVARGLEVAHRHGVVHRDLKPANVFLCHDLDTADLGASSNDFDHEDAKLLDFGVAKSIWEDEDAPTRENVVLGTPGYMSPEQIAGDGAIDVRTDVWALGAIAYRMIVGKPPFGVGTTSEVATRIAASTPSAPSVAHPGLPPELDEVFERALAKRPEARFAGARELADALSRAVGLAVPPADGVASTNDGAVVSRRASSRPPPAAPAPVVAASRPARQHELVAAAGLVVAAIAVLWLRPPPPASSLASEPVAATTSAVISASAAPSAPVGKEWTAGSVSASAAASAAASTSASASPSTGASSASSAAAPRKVVDTWNKKDEL